MADGVLEDGFLAHVLAEAATAHDESVMEWCRARSATVVAVGGDPRGAAASLRFTGDYDRDVALHAETLVAELVAARWWIGQGAADLMG